MKPYVYVVIAHRWGDPKNHSYFVGVFATKHSAIKAAEDETTERGGKYGCWVYESKVGIYDSTKIVYKSKSTQE